MTVTIPTTIEHGGYPGNLMTIEIANKCPQCGAKRGVSRWKGFSYDGSRRLSVDCWSNECEHIDSYANVRAEYWDAKEAAKEIDPDTETDEREGVDKSANVFSEDE